MILHSLRVEGFRCFAAPVEIPALSPGLNILHGPNASGKSTLLRALRHLMADSYSLSGQIAESQMRPWGRSLAPSITAVFEHNAQRFRISKRFFEQAQVRLDQWTEDSFQPVMEGKHADDRLRQMLLAEAPSRGLATEAHLGILQILWTPQGPPALESISTQVRSSIEQSLGAAALNPRAQQIKHDIESEYLQYFTEKGAWKKSVNSPLYPKQQELERHTAQTGQLHTQWLQAAQHRETARSLDDEIAGLSAAIAAGERELEQLEQKSVAFARLRLEASDRGRVESEARLHYQSLNDKVESWLADIKKLREAQDELAALTASIQSKKEEAEKSARRVDELNDRIFQLSSQRSYLEHSAHIARIRGILEQLARFRANEDDLLQQIAALPAPEPAEVPALRKLIQDLALTRGQLEAASLKLIFKAESDTTLEILRGSPEGAHSVATNGEAAFTGPEGVTFRIPGVGLFSAESANPAAAGLAKSLTVLERKAAQIVAGHDNLPLEQLLANAEQRALLQEKIQANRAEARGIGQNRKPPDWQEELDKHSAELAHLAPLFPKPPEPLTQRPEDLQPDLEFANDAKSRSASALAAAEERRKQVEKLKQELDLRLARHQAGPSIDILTQSRDEAALAHQAASASLRKATEEYAALGADPAPAIGQLQTALQRQKATHAQRKQELDFLQGQIHQTADSHLYSELAAAEERAAQLQADVNRASRRGTALARLRQELDAAGREVTAAVPKTVADAANVFWRKISGAPALVLNTELELDTLDATGFRAPHADLSGGEKEQASFALRLALAHQLAANERQLAVFDDSFLATDPSRTARILEILEASATERLQVLVLTCHPERYQSLAAANMLDLEALKQDART